MPQFSSEPRTERIAQALVKSGWREVSRNKHIKLQSPSGAHTVVVSISPSDGRAVLNWISQLRHMGLDVKAMLAHKHDKSRLRLRQHAVAM